MQINDSMTFNELVPSNSEYLKKEDVGESGLILTIRGFKREMIKGDHDEEEKTVMYFMENVKPMVLNVTNAQLIPVCTGAANAGEAKGKQVIAYHDPSISFGGRVIGGIRLRKVVQAPAPAAPAAPPAGPDPVLHAGEPDIPF